MKRLALAAVAVASLTFGVGSAVGARDQTTVDVFPVSFVLSSETCPNLPPGTTVTGTGTGTSVTTITTSHHGLTTFANRTIDHGTATDGHNQYVFFYFNEFRVTNSGADPSIFTGLMTDMFTLSGGGPANLSNGFLANVTTDLGSLFELDPISSFGDPIDFATGEARCDPL